MAYGIDGLDLWRPAFHGYSAIGFAGMQMSSGFRARNDVSCIDTLGLEMTSCGQIGVKFSIGNETFRAAIDRSQTIADYCVAIRNRLPRARTLGSFLRFEEEIEAF